MSSRCSGTAPAPSARPACPAPPPPPAAPRSPHHAQRTTRNQGQEAATRTRATSIQVQPALIKEPRQATTNPAITKRQHRAPKPATGECLPLWIASSVHGMNSRLYIALPAYLAVAICAYFISQGTYWVVTGTILSMLLTRPDHMKPSWHSPAYTPGIELLARIYRLAFYGASLGVALCLVPLLTWVYKVPDSGPLLVVKIGLFITSVTAALIIAIIPQWRLSMVVANQRRATIEQLGELLPSDANNLLPGNQSDSVILSWLQLVSASPSSTVQNSTIAGILLGLATVVLPYIVRFIV